MGLFSWFRRGKREGRKKRRTKSKVPEFPDRPIVGYVTREGPEKSWEGVRLRKKVGTFDLMVSVHELEDGVAHSAGGGGFKARVYDAIDKKKYLGIHRFRISGAPLIDGERPEPKTKKKSPEVQRIQAEIRLEKAKARLAQIQHRRRILARKSSR